MQGRPKGVTQLANFMADVIAGRYNSILPHNRQYTFYPLIVTTDHSFNLPTVNQTLDTELNNQITAGNFRNHLNEGLTRSKRPYPLVFTCMIPPEK
jgi:hypothetical protein